MESTITHTGFKSFKALITSSSREAERMSIFSSDIPSLSARERICEADSSPETYRTLPFVSINAAVCSKRVDLPIPGSPPISTAEHLVAPPPRTRSNSLVPVERRAHSIGLTDFKGTGFAGLCPENGTFVCGCEKHSSKLFHSPHSGHLPSHRSCV